MIKDALSAKRRRMLEDAFWRSMEGKLAVQSDEGFKTLLMEVENGNLDLIGIAEQLDVLNHAAARAARRVAKYVG